MNINKLANLNAAIDRRTLLKGLGVTMSLPVLEAMLPSHAVAAEAVMASTKLNRMAFVFVPNGVVMDAWQPKKEGTDFDLPASLEPLAKVKGKINVMTQLAQNNARALGDGPGDHARSAATFLTGEHPRKTAGADIQAGLSVDQLAAAKIGSNTKLPSLELGLEGGRNAGQCDSGYSCAYSNSISWKSPTTPMAKEIRPKLVFERLFGGGVEEIKNRQKRDHYRQSILDMVQADADQLNKKLGKTDRRKLDEYFTSVREIEQRLERAASDSAKIVIPEMEIPDGVPKDQIVHTRLMFDLMALAFQTDTTRVATFMLSNEGSNRSYSVVGVNEGHHQISHHQKKADNLDKLRKVDRHLITQFAYFLEKLDSIQEGNGTLLDNSMIVYGSAIGDGDRHNHNDLPILFAGRGNGTIDTGRHIVYPKDTPLNNLFLSMLERMDVPTDRLGDSTGKLDKLKA
ncbi:MAG: hypothetical protein C0478_11590 [Planctomyces sp.]|jgi:hypothetical protein|nr:hypothetical protein [Planctomyces sp.]